MRWGAGVLLVALAGCDGGRLTVAWERGPAEPSSDDRLAPWYGGPDYYSQWPHAWPSTASSIPIGIWMQSPENAARYRAVGINFYTGLWQGPTEAQLRSLAEARMPVMCHQDGVWQSHLDDPTIQAWLAAPEPDNAQLQADGSYGPCVEPATVVSDSRALRAADPTRPILLVFGDGVAEVGYPGRGACAGRTADYPTYVQGGDILSFGLYPLHRELPLELVATGVENLRQWSADTRPILPIIEASSLDDGRRPTPAELRAQVWLALIHGAAGIQYYCHRWEPELVETDCIDDPTTARALSELNALITDLAPVLNTPSVTNGVTVASEVRLDTMLKRHGGATYLFVAAPTSRGGSATFTFEGITSATVEVLGESRASALGEGVLTDTIEGYGTRVYRLTRD